LPPLQPWLCGPWRKAAKMSTTHSTPKRVLSEHNKDLIFKFVATTELKQLRSNPELHAFQSHPFMGDTLSRASFTLSTKAWYSLAALGAYTFNSHIDWFSTWALICRPVIPEEPNLTQSDNWRLVSIPTPACADTLGSAPDRRFHLPSRFTVPEPCLLVEETPTISKWYHQF